MEGSAKRLRLYEASLPRTIYSIASGDLISNFFKGQKSNPLVLKYENIFFTISDFHAFQLRQQQHLVSLR